MVTLSTSDEPSYKSRPEKKTAVPKASDLARFFGPYSAQHLHRSKKISSYTPESTEPPMIVSDFVRDGDHTASPGSEDLPENVRQLISDYERAEDQKPQLPCAFAYRRENLYKSRNGKPCQWLNIKTGRDVEPVRYHWRNGTQLIVIQGGGLPEPAIVTTRARSGVPQNCRLYTIWRGLQGDEPQPAILKYFGNGPVHEALEEIRNPVQFNRESSADSMRSTAILGKRSDRPDSRPESPFREESPVKRQFHFHDRRRGGTAMVGSSLMANENRILSTSFDSLQSTGFRRSSATSPPESRWTFDSSFTSGRQSNLTSQNSTSTSQNSITNSREFPTASREPSAFFVASEMANRTVFIFQKEDGSRPRIRPFTKCDTVERLFMHAKLGGLSTTKASILSVQVQGSQERLLVGEDDEEDYAEAIQAIRSDLCWALGENVECRVDVRAAGLWGVGA